MKVFSVKIIFLHQSAKVFSLKSFLLTVLFGMPFLLLSTFYGSYNIYYIAWADYVNGSVSGIAFLNFECTRIQVVSLCIAAAF